MPWLNSCEASTSCPLPVFRGAASRLWELEAKEAQLLALRRDVIRLVDVALVGGRTDYEAIKGSFSCPLQGVRNASEDETCERHVYRPYVPTSGSKRWKTENFALFQVLRQTLAEREGLSAHCLKPCDFNGFEPADFAVCTSHVY